MLVVFLVTTIVVTESDTPGLNEEDMAASIATLHSMAQALDAECIQLRVRNVDEGQVAEYLIRRHADESDFMEVR